MKKILILLALIPQFYINYYAIAFESEADYAIVTDYETKQVIYQKNGMERMVPASMTKLMTVYIIFDQLQKGNITLKTPVYISENAYKTGGSRFFLNIGESVKVEDLIRGIIVSSGNDACVSIAEHLAGTEESFAEQMNYYAKNLGLRDTSFMNSNGLPGPNHYSSPYDLALIATALINDFPQYYHYFSEVEFQYNGIKQGNRNTLLKRPGVDGLKTGHTEESGYGIAFSAVRGNDWRLIFVINGLKSEKEREKAGDALLNYTYGAFTRQKIFNRDEIIAKIPVLYGTAGYVEVLSKAPISLITRKASDKQRVFLRYFSPFKAPIKPDQHIADLIVKDTDGTEIVYPLVSKDGIAECGFLGMIADNLYYMTR